MVAVAVADWVISAVSLALFSDGSAVADRVISAVSFALLWVLTAAALVSVGSEPVILRISNRAFNLRYAVSISRRTCAGCPYMFLCCFFGLYFVV